MIRSYLWAEVEGTPGFQSIGVARGGQGARPSPN